MRWQSTADKPESPHRERFATSLNVLGIFFSFMFLLVLLYPEQGLLGVLSGGDDAATIRYREALLRIRPGDTALRFKVAGSLVRSGGNRRALEVLSSVPAGLTADQQRLLADLRYMALKNVFIQARHGDAEWERLRPLFLAAANELAGPNPPAWRLQEFASDARKAGDLDSWQAFDRKAKESLNTFLAQNAEKQDYRAIADHFFELMNMADTITRRRELFFSAVRTLQAGNLPLEAFNAGERHMDGLSSDRAALIFLTRAALAAGQPARAQRLIKRALRMDEKPLQPGNS
jgi:hypothetical protein